MAEVWYLRHTLRHNLSHTNGGMKRWFIESGMFIFIIFYIDLNCKTDLSIRNHSSGFARTKYGAEPITTKHEDTVLNHNITDIK